MKVQYIRREIPEEISSEGGAYIQLVNKTTTGLPGTIEEAIRGLYCVGEVTLIKGYFLGLIRSVFAGIKADGNARCIGDIRFYPACGGTFDLSKGWDPLVNDVRIYAELVNGVTLDVSDWSFEDVTLGKVAFKLEAIENGSGVADVVSNGSKVCINGKSIPAASNLDISWVCGTKSGTLVASEKTTTCNRIDLADSVLNTLTAADNGKEVTFTVKGCYNKATIKATFAYVAPELQITKTTQDGEPDNTLKLSGDTAFVIHGGTFDGTETVRAELYEDGTLVDYGDLSDDRKVGSIGSEAINCTGTSWGRMTGVAEGRWYAAGADTRIVVKRGTTLTAEKAVTFVAA